MPDAATLLVRSIKSACCPFLELCALIYPCCDHRLCTRTDALALLFCSHRRNWRRNQQSRRPPSSLWIARGDVTVELQQPEHR